MYFRKMFHVDPMETFCKIDKNLNFDLFWPFSDEKWPKNMTLWGLNLHMHESIFDIPVNQVSWWHSKMATNAKKSNFVLILIIKN